MNWLKRTIARWADEGREEAGRGRRANYISDSPEIATSDDTPSGDPILNFKVYSAVGGRIVEFRRYDRKLGNNDVTSYIITDDQNFGERIAKIATMENLKS